MAKLDLFCFDGEEVERFICTLVCLVDSAFSCKSESKIFLNQRECLIYHVIAPHCHLPWVGIVMTRKMNIKVVGICSRNARL